VASNSVTTAVERLSESLCRLAALPGHACVPRRGQPHGEEDALFEERTRLMSTADPKADRRWAFVAIALTFFSVKAPVDR
jgi:hypothetical protein